MKKPEMEFIVANAKVLVTGNLRHFPI